MLASKKIKHSRVHQACRDLRIAWLCAALVLCGGSLLAKDKATSTKDLADVVAESNDLSTLMSALKAVNFMNTLKEAGPFTLFAPTNAAFAKLPEGTLEKLLKPENKDTLNKILSYHVSKGTLTAKQLRSLIKNGHDKAELKTVEGTKLIASFKGRRLILVDEKGAAATITKSDIAVKNGVIHIIDTVIMPN